MGMDFRGFLAALGEDLGRTLPGRAAQYAMAPVPRPGGEIHNEPPADARHGGVLMLLYPHGERVYLPLILRPTYEGVHSGQVALPGGKQDATDVDLVATALREAEEEIHVDRGSVHLLGLLTPIYIVPSNFWVQPVIGWTRARPDLRPDPREVEMLIEVPLDELVDPGNRRVEVRTLRERTANVPLFYVQGQTIWGATAMMLAELLALPTMAKLARQEAGDLEGEYLSQADAHDTITP